MATTLLEAARRLGIDTNIDNGKAQGETSAPEVLTDKQRKEGLDAYKKYVKELDKQAAANSQTPFQEMVNRTFATSSDNPFSFMFQNRVYEHQREAAKGTDFRPRDDWSEDERAALGLKYLESSAAARQYAQQLNIQKNNAEKEKTLTDVKTAAGKNVGTGALATVGGIVGSTLGMVDFLDDLARVNARREIGTAQGASLYEMSQAAMEGVTEQLNSYGTLPENWWIIGGKGFGDLYGLGTSVVQSAVTAKAFGPGGTLLSYFGQSAARGVDTAKEKGASDGQAMLYGALMGAAEAIPEMISADALLGIGKEATKSLFKQVLKQAGEEAGEEATTSILELVIDKIIFGENNIDILAKQYEASGMSRDEAVKKAWIDSVGEVLYSAVSGFVSGGISGSGAAAISTTNLNAENRAAKEQLAPMQSQMFEQYKTVQDSTDRATVDKLAAKAEKGKELSGYDLRRLQAAVAEGKTADIEANVKLAIAERLKSKGVKTEDISALTNIIMNKALGQKLTKAQQIRLKNSEVATAVSNELDINNMLSGNFDSQWAIDAGVNQIRDISGTIMKALFDADQQDVGTTETHDVTPIIFDQQTSGYTPQSENTRIHTDEVRSTLNAKQTAQIRAIEKVANALGVETYIYESELKNGVRSYTTKDGAVITDNGYYDPKDKSVHIDLHAGETGKGTMLFTASHELVHWVKDSALNQYESLQKFVIGVLHKEGVQIDTLIKKQIEAAKANGREMSRDEALEEIVADACMSVLSTDAGIKAVTNLKTENRGLWNTLKRFFANFFNRIDKIYKGEKVDSEEGQYLADMHEEAKRLRDLFVEGVAAASEANKTAAKNTETRQTKAETGAATRKASGRNAAVDSNGNALSAEQQEFFKDSKARDKKGNLLVLYHGTTADFSTFKKGDVGFHFGTKGAARGRVGYGKNTILKEVYLNITNPIVFDEDLGSWDADYRLTRELYDMGILTQEDAESVLFTDDRQYRRTTEKANKKLAEVLLSKGYDGIAYENTFEGKKTSTSYIIFNSNQAKEITNKTPTSNSDIRYSGRKRYTEYDKPITVDDIAVLRSIGGKSINSFNADDTEKAQKWAYKFYKELGVKSPFFRAWFGDWREFDNKTEREAIPVSPIAVSTKDDAVAFFKKGLKEHTLFRGDVVNDDTKFTVNIGNQVYNDTITYANRDYSRTNDFGKYKARLSLLSNIKKIVEQSILLDSAIIKDEDNANRTFMHYFYSVCAVQNEPYLVKVGIDELNSDLTTTRRAYNVNSIKITPIAVTQLFRAAGTMSVGGEVISTYNIADLFALVKQYDKDFSPKAANPLLLDENKQPKVFYHGTSAKFDEFDINRAGQNWGGDSRLGKGIYFAHTENEALRWTEGTNVIKAYLNLKNPLDVDAPTPKNISDEIDKYIANKIASFDENDSFISKAQYIKNLERIREMYMKDVSMFISEFKYDKDGRMTDGIRQFLASLGYDGIISKKEVVAFYPEQIKSATDNIGTFDSTERNIKYSSRKKRTVSTDSLPFVSDTAGMIVSDIAEAYEPTKKDKLETAVIASQIAFTNAQAGIEAIAKKYGIKNMESLVQAARVASHQAEEMIVGNQYRIGSDSKDYMGEGLQKIMQPIDEQGEATQQAFFDYLFHHHNADRMSLERRSIEWNEETKAELTKHMKRYAELEAEWDKLKAEREAIARKRSKAEERGKIDLRLSEINRERVAVNKLIRKLRKQVDEFVPMKNKAVLALNREQIEARKAEIAEQIAQLEAERKELGRSKANASRVTVIKAEIASLKEEEANLSAEVTEEQSRDIIAKYDKAYPGFADVAEKIWKYNANLNQYRVDTGLITQDAYDYMQKLYPHYVPTYRDGASTGIAAVKGKNNLAVSKTVKSATGSTRDLLNPIVIMARQTMETVRAGRVNQIATTLFDAAGNDKTYLAEVSRKKVSASELVDLDPTELRPKGNQVTFYKDGKRVVMQVSSELFAGFDAFSPQVDIKNPLLNGVAKVNDVFKRLVTSANPIFLLRNSIRDIQDAGINTKYPTQFLKNYARAVKMIQENGDLWNLYKAMGGSNQSYFDFDKGFKMAQTKRGFAKTIKPGEGATKVQKTKALANDLLAKIESANAYVELLPRFAEFISSVEAGNTAEQAMLDAADVTTNFARTGKVTKVLNSTVIPFLNPAIQGASKAVRNITSIRSVREAVILATKAAIVGIAPYLLNALLYGDDEDYEVLRETDKENNHLIKIGDVFVKLPRGRMASVLAGLVNRTGKTVSGENADWVGYLKNASTQMNPFENMARTIFSPFLDVANNVTWYGSAIEGKEFENKSPKDRYDENTSAIAIAIGKVINYSPKKIHYLIDQYSGVIGDFLLPATTKKAEKDFLSGNLTIDPVMSNKLSDNFYDIYYDAQYAKSADENNKTAEYQVKHLNRVKSAISKLFDEKSRIQSSDLPDRDKLEQTRAIQVLINKAYKTAIDDYELVTKAIEATASVDDKYRYAEITRLVYGADAALEVYDEKVYAQSKVMKKAGISANVFYKYYFSTADIKSDTDKNGNAISGSKRNKVIAAIDKLNLTEEKRLLLIASKGYALAEKERTKLIRYINSLKLTESSKKALAEMCGFEVKNGKIVYK